MKQKHSVSYFVGYTVLALDYHRETRSVYVTVSAKTQLSEVFLHNDVGYIHLGTENTLMNIKIQFIEPIVSSGPIYALVNWVITDLD